MKKFLFLMMAVLTTVGCSNDDDKLNLSTNNIALKFEGTAQITASEQSTWGSDDEFVATVNDEGLVTGEHVGKTIITAKSENGSAKCEVIVNPQYNTYADPVFEFGAGKSTIKSKESRALQTEEATSLLFKPDKSGIQGVGYMFENGEMTSIGVNVKTAYGLEATKFLIERYLVIGAGIEDFAGIMLNNLPSKATMSIAMSVRTGDVLVLYIPYNKNKVRSAVEEDIMAAKMEELFDSVK